MPENYSLEDILKVGQLTGSRAFNCAHKDSDWDIIITEKDLPNYLEQHPSYYVCADWENRDGSDDADGIEDNESIYDPSIWGPILQIVKYEDSAENTINLFIYAHKHRHLLDKFKELNKLMKFLYPHRLKDKATRIIAFIHVMKELGITDTK